MRNLSVYQRFAMIIAALTIVLFAVSALQILVLRDAVLDELERAHHLVGRERFLGAAGKGRRERRQTEGGGRAKRRAARHPSVSRTISIRRLAAA